MVQTLPFYLSGPPTVHAADLDRIAFAHHRRSVTFSELDERAARFATGAARAGLVPGDRVLILSPNAPEVFELLIGCARAGLVAVPLNWRLAPAERAAVVADADARGYVAAPELAPHLEPVHDAAALALTLGEEYEQWLRSHPPAAGGGPTDPDAVVLQVYTSGTSGQPKGVQLTHRNLAAKIPRTAALWGLGHDSVSLLATPLFHVGALSWGLAGLAAGATTILAGDAATDTLLGHLVQDRVTHTFLVPVMISQLCAAAPDGMTFPQLRAVVYGAAPISPEARREALSRFGPVLHHVYGLTETTGAVTELAPRPDLAPDDPLQRSVGKPYPWVELVVRDPGTGSRVRAGEQGEVWVRSEQNTPGYAGRPRETSALVDPDGWLRTGDGGYLDEDGYLFLTDRVKDLIITGGENVLPGEVEAVLATHPDLAEVAAFGVPDPMWGESVAAAVVPRPGASVSPDEVASFCVSRLAGYKRPRRVLVLERLPRNAAGKVLRRRLTELG